MATPTASSATSDASCPDIDLRSPFGDRVNLNGAWATELEGIRGGLYYFRQVGSCVWFVGGFPHPDDLDDIALSGPLGLQTVLFHGRVGEDFVIRGEWIDGRNQFVDQPGPRGTIELRIVFDAAGVTHIEYVGGSGQPFIEPGYRENQSWIQVSLDGTYPPDEPLP